VGAVPAATEVEDRVLQAAPWSWRGPAIASYGIAFAALVVLVGVPTDPYSLFAILWVATIAWNIRDPWRSHLTFVRDWGPVLVGLVIYLYSRGLSDEVISAPVHVMAPIDVDRFFFGELPTVTLQHAWCGDPCLSSSSPRWYDAVFTTVYYSRFVTGLTVAVVLWLRDRAAWLPWMRRYVVINFAALVVYIVYPMAPPWLASKDGYTGEHIARLTGRGWDDLGLGGFHTALARVGNPVAAMPSLHAGIAFLVAIYGVTRLRSRWRWLLLLYPVLMGLTLVHDGEHYVLDIAAGWVLAGLVMLGCRWWEEWRGQGVSGEPAQSIRASSAPG
jgi:hypothetical protein